VEIFFECRIFGLKDFEKIFLIFYRQCEDPVNLLEAKGFKEIKSLLVNTVFEKLDKNVYLSRFHVAEC
jgi:hypothetical protein